MENSEVAEIIYEHRNMFYKVAMMYAHSRDEADDIFQEISIQVFRTIDSFKGNSKLSSWLYRVAINVAISWIRKERKFGNRVLRECSGLEECSPFYVEEEDKEAMETLRLAISKLSEVDRTLVLLYLDEVEYPEIANILGISEVNVRVRMNRVKKKLRKLIGDE